MAALLRNRWFQLAGVGVVAAFLLGFVSADLLSTEPSGPTFGPVRLTTGGAVILQGTADKGGGGQNISGPPPKEEVLPVTGAEAVAAGWKDPFLCSQGRGKYFQKVGEGIPYILMYDSADDLIGVYQISMAEMPSPWEFTKEIFGGAGSLIDYEHWGLFIYFRDPTQACEITQGSGGYYR